MTKFEVQEDSRNFLRDFGVEEGNVSRVFVIENNDTSPRILLFPKSSWIDGIFPWIACNTDWDDCDVQVILNRDDFGDGFISRYVRMHELGHVVWFFALREGCMGVLDKVLSVMKDTMRGASAKLLDIKVRKRRFGEPVLRPSNYRRFPSTQDYTYADGELFAMWFSWKMCA